MKWDKKPILQFRKDGSFVRRLESAYKSNTFGDENGLFAETSVSRCARGERRSYRGYIWIYESDYTIDVLQDRVREFSNRWVNKKKAVVKLGTDGSFVERYDSITEARDKNFLSSEISIINVIKKKRGYETCCGYRWMYEEEYLMDVL